MKYLVCAAAIGCALIFCFVGLIVSGKADAALNKNIDLAAYGAVR